MNQQITSPDYEHESYDENYHDNVSENSELEERERSLTLENPYDIHHRDRANVGLKKPDAVKKWKKKVIICSLILMLTSGILIYSNIWYANVIGVAAAFLGIYGAIKENSEFLFVYLVLLFLELLKNVGVFFYFTSGKGGTNTISIMLSYIGCVAEEIVVIPANLFYAFKLYRTLKISDDDLDETLSKGGYN